MHPAKRLFFVSLGILALAVAFPLGARSARDQGGTVQQLTTPEAWCQDAYPTFSPNGSQVAFFRFGPAAGEMSLMVADVPSGATTVLVPGSQLPSDMAASGGIEWSPDGSYIVLCGRASTGQGIGLALWLADVVGPPIQTTPTTWGRIKAERR